MNLFVSLKYLVALDDHRHFGRAALACHVTQPALSNALKALEENFGTAIVKRGRSFAGFTAEGERILVSARRMLHEHELLQQDLHSREGDPRGQLTIGSVPTALPIAARFAAMLRARHPGIVPTLRSLSSVEIETGLESLALDMGLGYTERMDGSRSLLRLLPQYTEHYFLLRKAAGAEAQTLQIGAAMTWAEAAALPLCLLSPEMHNRTIVDRAFAAAQVSARPAIETDSIPALALSVVAGNVCSILPGTLVGAVQEYRGLEARPLVSPEVEVPIAFMVHDTNRPSRTLKAALAFAQDAVWLRHAAQHSGLLTG
ncbi:MAG TPA: LysR family transcriptional regulator [Ideonella sp.]|jgi:DNA-binding transcriptional LysR family regulator|nr:LysR family transcriptional regulator [Ideonella sp.]